MKKLRTPDMQPPRPNRTRARVQFKEKKAQTDGQTNRCSPGMPEPAREPGNTKALETLGIARSQPVRAGTEPGREGRVLGTADTLRPRPSPVAFSILLRQTRWAWGLSLLFRHIQWAKTKCPRDARLRRGARTEPSDTTVPPPGFSPTSRWEGSAAGDPPAQGDQPLLLGL